MKKKILFINQKQFGYHISYVQYCKYLKKDFDITYYCWDYKMKRITEEGINILYVSRKGNLIKRNFRFIKLVFPHIRKNNYDKIFINYFRGCSVIPILCNHKYRIHLHIVTGSVSFKVVDRFFYNLMLKFECNFFRSVSIISKGLRDFFKLNENTYILPLGASQLHVNRKPTREINLLYIGTFTDRRMEDTIEGLGIFVKQNPNVEIHYTLIGNGWRNEVDQIVSKINECGLENIVELKDYLPFSKLKPYYERANFGVSYVPITPFYEYQPVSKTFEYLMAGLPVIATDTYENRQIINDHNGILIRDNPESFAKNINRIYNDNKIYDEKTVRNSVSEFEWEKIVNNMKNTILE